MNHAISFRNVSKTYRIGSYRGSLRSLLLGRANEHPDPAKTLKALDDVSFDVHSGEAVGLIGHNGAGKTTILKLLSRVTCPTRGSIAVQGRLSALIQLGAGFHPDLSGRDNVYLNGAILGLTQAEIRRRFDEIVAFAELEQFIDTPVKRYSSGMYARLGFAVAVHVSPDVLLVDEVLAVGDTAFQYRCLQKMREFLEAGRTIVFVSHNLDAVQSVCNRVLWVDRGKLRCDGPPAEVITSYLQQDEERALISSNGGSKHNQGPLHIDRVVLRDGAGRETQEFASGDDIIVDLHYSAQRSIRSPYASIGVGVQSSGILFLATMLLDDWQCPDLSGMGVLSCRFTDIQLMPRVYQVWGSIRDERAFADIMPWQPLCSFAIASPPLEIASHNGYKSISHLKADAPIYVTHHWELKEK
jgi:ABC-type polysaccharide/polyol phosphate transport system ATPase subunit